MPRHLTAVALCLGLVPFAFADGPQKDHPKSAWLTDYASALQQSKRSSKPLFVVFR